MANLPKAIDIQIQCNSFQITHDIFHRTRTNPPNIYMDPQKTQKCQSNPEEQKPRRRHNSPRLQAILQTHSHQDSVVLVPKHTERPMEQKREPRNKPRHLCQLIFDKGGKNIKWGKDSLFSKWCWETWTAACNSVKLEHTLTPCTKINSKWHKDLNVRQDTVKCLEENIGKTFSDVNHTNVFLGQFPKAIKINKLDLMKLTTFAQQRKH